MNNFAELIAACKPGYSLPQAFYCDALLYRNEIMRVWNRNWIWVGHVSQIPETGDFFTFDYGPESFIILRDRSGDIRAHMNICRHRGSRICTSGTGTARSLVCPYHGWTYELEGGLRSGPRMGEDFEPDRYSLHSAAVHIFQGMIFVNADENALSLDKPLSELAKLTRPFNFERIKIAHTASYLVPANWKLAYENYLECYHCAPAHKEYARSHSLKSPEDLLRLSQGFGERSSACGLPVTVLDQTGVNATAPCADVYYRRYPLYDGYETGSRTGAPLAPLLGELTGFDGGATDLQIGMLNHFLVYSDHMVGYRFVPRGPLETDMQIVWMVHEEAVEDRDYVLADLTWLWDVTSRDDERIIRLNQVGVMSSFYRPGPLSQMEWAIPNFHATYIELMTNCLPQYSEAETANA